MYMIIIDAASNLRITSGYTFVGCGDTQQSQITTSMHTLQARPCAGTLGGDTCEFSTWNSSFERSVLTL